MVPAAAAATAAAAMVVMVRMVSPVMVRGRGPALRWSAAAPVTTSVPFSRSWRTAAGRGGPHMAIMLGHRHF